MTDADNPTGIQTREVSLYDKDGSPIAGSTDLAITASYITIQD